jgi:hypothetical protein
MKRDLRCTARRTATLALALWSFAGCAVLNKDQINEVQRFAGATQNYGTLPGRVLVAYAEVRSTNNELQLETAKYGKTKLADDAWTLLDATPRQTGKILDAAAEVDDALEVLDDYAAQLSALSSDDYTKQIEESATDLSNKIDGGVAFYNKQYGKSVSSPGAVVGAVVRGLGDWYVKVQQARLLKARVHAADEMVQTLTADVETGLVPFVLRDPPPKDGRFNLMEDEQKQLHETFQAAGSRHDLTPDFVNRVSSAKARIDTGSALAAAAISSAQKYRQAHAKLVATMDDTNVLSVLRDDISAVRAEVKATQKFEKRLKEQQKQ